MDKDLIICVKNFNEIAGDPNLIKELRKLTLNHFSGMNHELNNFEKIAKTREVKAKIFLAYIKNDLVGWALVSREPSDYYFEKFPNGFDPSYGALFEIFISYLYRRQGIGSELLKIARRKLSPYKLCFVPWNKTSDKFYNSFKPYKHKNIA